MHVVYVDFDGTLVKTNSLNYVWFLRKYACAQKITLLNMFMFITTLFAFPLIVILWLIKCDIARDVVTYWLYYGLTDNEIQLGNEKFWLKPNDYFRANILEELQGLKKSNALLVIVSGSLSGNIEAAFKSINLPNLVDHYIVTELAFTPKGHCTGRILGLPNIVEEKKRNIALFEKQLNVPVAYRTCFSDAASDISFLQLADRAVMVHPEKALKKIGNALGWETVI